MGRGRGHYRPVVKVDVKTRRVIERYPSLTEAGKAHGVGAGSIYSRCNSKVRSTSTFYFRFEEDFEPTEDIAIRYYKKKQLSNREKHTLALIMTSIEQRQVAPTLIEIAKFLGVSKERARQVVEALEKKGWVKRDPRVPRGIKLTPQLLAKSRLEKDND